MSKVPENRSTLRRAIHGFVYSVCAVSLGITPPPEEKEVLFLGLLIGVLLLIAARRHGVRFHPAPD